MYINETKYKALNHLLRSTKGTVDNIRLMQTIEDKGKPKKRRSDRVMKKLDAIEALAKIIKG